jgi:hypothetical protein
MRNRMGVVAAVLMFAALVVHAQQAPPGPAPAGAQGAPPAEGRGAGAGRGRQAGPPPRILTFEARPSSIKPGESVQLVWHTENPAAPAIEPGVGRVVPRGTTRVTPVATTTYVLTNGAVTNSVTVVVAGTKPAAAAPSAPAAPTAGKGIARTAEGKPDFSGVYAFGGGGGRGAGAGRGAAPAGPVLKPGAEKYRVNRADNPLDTGRTSDCMPLIPPDAFGVPYQFQITQNREFLVFFHEYPGTFRIIRLDGQRDVLEPDPAWLGDSVGRWDGDTIVIDTIGYNDKTEISGFRHTEALHTVERLTRIDDGFDYEITIEDPNVFAAPWKVNRTFRFNVPPMKRIMEFVCENNRDYRPLFGTQAPQGNR